VAFPNPELMGCGMKTKTLFYPNPSCASAEIGRAENQSCAREGEGATKGNQKGSRYRG
jgi:hypothetical protein